MPPSTPVEKEILQPNKYDIESATLPRRKKQAKELRSHPAKDSHFTYNKHPSTLADQTDQKDYIRKIGKTYV